MKLLGWPRTGILAFIAAAVIAAACGSPDPKVREFVFTPVPYTVLPAEPGETPVVMAVDEDGNEYFAAELVVLIPRVELDDFLGWLDDVGLAGQRLDADRTAAEATRAAEAGIVLDKALVFVKVPRGGAIAARDLLRTRPGLGDVELSYPFYTDEAP